VTAPKPWRRRVSRSGGVPLGFVTDAPPLAAGSFTEVSVLPYLTLVAVPELWPKDHGDGTKTQGQRYPMNDVYRIKFK